MDSGGDAAAAPRGWTSWRRVTEALLSRVSAEVAGVTGLSEADFTVLAALADHGSPVDGSSAAGSGLRQGELGEAIGWPRARLSTHLSRMADRGLVVRANVEGAVVVRATREGATELAAARPVHEAAVRRHVLDPLDTGQLDALEGVLVRWSGGPGRGR